MQEEVILKKAETAIGIVPMNEHIIVKMPVISKRTKSGLIKSDKVLEEERKNLPKYVEVVAIAQNSEFNIGDYVRPAPDATYVRIDEGENESYGIISSFSIIAKLSDERKLKYIADLKEQELKELLKPQTSSLEPRV